MLVLPMWPTTLPNRLASRRCRLNTPAVPPNIIVRIVQTGRNIPYNHYIMVGHLNSTPFARHATEENRTVAINVLKKRPFGLVWY
jgi:hypothetical protein